MENRFRINTQSLKEHFLFSLAGKDIPESCYVEPSIPQSWVVFQKDPKVQKVSVPDYEKRILEIINTKSDKSLSNPITVIRGGIGTGKSTFLNRIIKKSNLCHNCMDNLEEKCDYKAINLFFDFKDSGTSTEEGDISKWTSVLRTLDMFIGEIKPEKEVRELWPWIFDNLKPFKFFQFYKILERAIPHLGTPNNIFLYSLRDSFYSEISIEELCHYKLFIIKYLRRARKNYCSLAIFDNLDHLEPIDQKEMVSFALKVQSLLNSKVLMMMRPHTLTRLSYATNLIEVIDHCMPDPMTVIERRIENYFRYGNESETLTPIMFKLVTFINSRDYYQKVFLGSAGISIRSLLTNFFNLLLSPILQAEEDGVTNVGDWKANEFHQAFFCHETDDSLLDLNNFVNLFTTSCSDSLPQISTLKLRILHRLFYVDQNYMLLGTLFNELIDFGYEDKMIVASLNELLDKHKPLIWSDNQLSYDYEYEIPRTDSIILAPLGLKYFKDIVNQVFYLKECVNQYHKHRYLSKDEWPNISYTFLKEFAMDDKHRCIDYIKSTSFKSFKSLYTPERFVTGYYWPELSKKLKYFSTKSQIEMDINYHHHIYSRILREMSY